MQSVCEPVVCHGDLHLSNVLMHVLPPEEAPACVIDPEPVVMPWALEAAYPQILNSDPARGGWNDLVQRMGAQKRARGHCDLTDAELALLQRIALSWLALRQWSIQGPAPDPSWRAPDIWRSWNAHYIDEGATATRTY